MSAHLTAPLTWLVAHSWQGGVLVLLVLLVQWVFRRYLTNRWRFALWWIVLLRLLMPFSPESAVSVFNFFRPSAPLPVTIPSVEQTNEESRNQYPAIDSALPSNVADSPDKFRATTASILPSIPSPPHLVEWRRWIVPGFAVLWMAGVLLLTGTMGIQLFRFQRKLARDAQPAKTELCELLEECRSEFNTRRTIELLETDAVQSPALFGFFRLRLLLPRGMGRQFCRAELRYIFLHELAHVKRGDLWLNWLVTGLLILLWFNPLLWLGFARLRADRELACDELALVRAGDQAGTAYGETVVKLLEHLSRSPSMPGLVGILEDAGQMRRRIAMIASFHRPGRRSVLAVVLVGALAAVALTNAQSEKPPAPSVGPKAESSRTLRDAQASEPGNAMAPQLPPPKLTAGDELKGVVLRPDGTPDAQAQVALQVEGKVFCIGRYDYQQEGHETLGDFYFECDSSTQAWKGGSFNLPMQTGAKSIAALSPNGYAQVSLEEFQHSSQIHLQKWGRVEGVLHEAHGVGARQNVVIDSKQSRFAYWHIPNTLTPPQYDPRGFQTETDDQGRFIFTHVPPGEIILSKRTQGQWGDTRNYFHDNQLAMVNVGAGMTVVTNVGGTGRRVVGRLKFSGGATPDFTNGLLDLTSPPLQLFARLNQMKTMEERAAFARTEEFKTAMKNSARFAPVWQADQSFIVEEVPAGRYDLMLFLPQHKPGDHLYGSRRELTVPPRKDDHDDAVVDLGVIEMTEWLGTTGTNTGT